jgi:hypothetical protein
MKRAIACPFAACAALLAAILLGPGVALGQAELFTLSIEGPTQLSGNANDVKTGLTYYPTLDHKSGPGPGAQGWSYGINTQGGMAINALTFEGTAAATIPNGGFRDPEGSFNKTQVIDPAKNGGKTGMVSAIALSTGGLAEAVLPATGVQRIYKMDVSATIPAGGGTGRFVYMPGLIGSGQPVDIVITQEGNSAPHELVALDVDLNEEVSTNCCDADVNVGFLTTIVKNGTVYQGIVDDGDMCTGVGEVIAEGAVGAPNDETIYAGISSDVPGAPGTGVQGWSYGILVEGAANLVSITIAGTSADSIPNGGYRDPEGSFNKTQIIDPSKNGGKRGLVSAIALTTQGLPEAVFPNAGTQTIVCMNLTSAAPQGVPDQTGSVEFEPGLIGSGQPVDTVVTVNGNSAVVCNFTTAKANIIFRRSEGPVDRPFRRGYVNPDGKFDIADGIHIINYLVRSGPEPACLDAADINDDGAVDVTDGMLAVFYLFQPPTTPNPDPAPAAPFTACGTDSTPDSVTCNASPSICP